MWKQLISRLVADDVAPSEHTAPSGYAPSSSLPAGTAATGPYTFRRDVSFTKGPRTAPYHIDASAAEASTPAPLVIHLHGDGYQEYTEMAAGRPSIADRYLEVARAHGAICVIPRTPDTSSETWYTKSYPTKWLVALIKEIKRTYNVDTRRIFFSGFSGGAEQITYNMICDHHELLDGGGAMILGGGGADGISFTGTPAAGLRANFPMRWFVGEHDVAGATQPVDWSARDSAEGGAAFCRAAGFTTSTTVIPGAAHDDSEPFGPYYLNEVINETSVGYGLPEVAAPVGINVPPGI